MSLAISGARRLSSDSTRSPASPDLVFSSTIAARRARVQSENLCGSWVYSQHQPAEKRTALAAEASPPRLMPEMPYPSEHHRHTKFIRGVNHVLIVHRAAGLDHGRGAGFPC